jgi:nitroreductase
MQAIDALLNRRSAKSLTAPAPDEGALELIFASAAAAPDHGRLRPWRFIVIQGSSLARFGDLLADLLERREPAA